MVKFLRSMRFGIILMLLICLISALGSLVPQGNDEVYYTAQYAWGDALLFLGVDHIYTTVYFITLLVLLCINLSLCSLSRYRSMQTVRMNAVKAAAEKMPRTPISVPASQRLAQYLASHGFRKNSYTLVDVYARNRFGHYATFITHLSILLVLIFAALGMYLPVVTDYSLASGESVTLQDGTVVEVLDFRMTDAQGETAYASDLRITDTQGVSYARTTLVNHPVSVGKHVLYQQSYSVCGAVRVYNSQTDVTDDLLLTEASTLIVSDTADITYIACYPDYVTEEDGQITPRNTGDYARSVYLVNKREGEKTNVGVVLPGQTIYCEHMQFTFYPPVFASGLRVKTSPAWILWGLYTAFALLVYGLFVCFFQTPEYIAVALDGYAISGVKNSYGIRRIIKTIVEATEEKESC